MSNELVRRVDSANMSRLFVESLLADEDDFLSGGKVLTSEDVRQLRRKDSSFDALMVPAIFRNQVNEKDDKKRERARRDPGRVEEKQEERKTEAEAEKENSLRSLRAIPSNRELPVGDGNVEREGWLVASPSMSERRRDVNAADSVDAYLKLKDSSRPSFSRRSANSSTEKCIPELPSTTAYRIPSQDANRSSASSSLLDRTPDLSETGLDVSQSSTPENPATPDSAVPLSNRSSGTANRQAVSTPTSEPAMGSETGTQATPTPRDPPFSPCSSQESVGKSPPRSRIPRLGESARSDTPPSEGGTPRSARSSTPTYTPARSATPNSVITKKTDPVDSHPRPKSAMSRLPRFGYVPRKSQDESKQDGGNLQLNFLSPRSEPGSEVSQQGSNADECVSKRTHKLFSGIPRLAKSAGLSAVTARKGTRLRPKQDSKLSHIWKENQVAMEIEVPAVRQQ